MACKKAPGAPQSPVMPVSGVSAFSSSRGPCHIYIYICMYVCIYVYANATIYSYIHVNFTCILS